MENATKEKEMIVTNVCPTCGRMPLKATISETCNLYTDKTQSLFTVCAKSKELLSFRCAIIRAEEAGETDIAIEDPCMDCSHNIIVQDPGTFVKMKDFNFESDDKPTFTEIHQCSCGTVFEVNR